MTTKKKHNNILISLKSISPALRWSLVGFCFSTLGNSAYSGSVLPSMIIVGLPAWVISFSATFGTVADFFSPVSAWIVDKLGGFRALAMTEGVEGVLSLLPLLIPFNSPYWKWTLLALSCAFLLTGQVIDIASEVFDVEAAGGNDRMIITYSGIISIFASLTGGLLGSPLGAWIASWSIPAVLIFSSVTSFAACATRFIMKQDIAQSTPELVGEAASVETSDDSDTHDGADNSANSDEKSAASTSVESDAKPKLFQQIMLLAGSFLVAFIPGCSTSYILLGLGKQYTPQSLTMLYIVIGVGCVLASVLYAHIAPILGLRKIAIAGICIDVIAYVAMLVNYWPLLCVAFFVKSFGGEFIVEPIIVARQILFKGSGLARFSGWARLAFAIGATGGSWIGLTLVSSWRWLPILAVVLTFGLIMVLPQLPNRSYLDE